jgi:hypothetical protein
MDPSTGSLNAQKAQNWLTAAIIVTIVGVAAVYVFRTVL